MRSIIPTLALPKKECEKCKAVRKKKKVVKRGKIKELKNDGKVLRVDKH